MLREMAMSMNQKGLPVRSKGTTRPRPSLSTGGPYDALERRQLATAGQARSRDRVRPPAAHVLRRPQIAAALRAAARSGRSVAPGGGRPRGGIQPGREETV